MSNITFQYVNRKNQMPQKRWFYRCKNMVDKNTNKQKDKYKLCFQIIESLDTCVYIIATSKDYGSLWWLTFSFDKTHMENITEELSVKNFINITPNNQSFEFSVLSNICDLLLSWDHILMGLLKFKKFTELNNEIRKSKKAVQNYQNTAKANLLSLGIDLEGLSEEELQNNVLQQFWI